MSAVNVVIETLIASVRRRAMFPATSDGSAFPLDSDILAMLNEEVDSWLVPFIMDFRKGHFQTHVDIPLVAGQQGYLIPPRAAGGDIGTVQLVDPNGNPILPQLAPEDLEVVIGYPFNQTVFGQPTLYAFQGNQIILSPVPQSGGSPLLRVYYPQRPNQLVMSTAVGVVTSITQVGGNFRIVYSGSPANFNSAVPYEVVHAQPGYEVVPVGTANGTGSGYIQFPGTVPTGINVGDYLCLEDTAPVVTGVSADLTQLLCQWVAIKLIEYRGDTEQLSRASASFKAAEDRARDFLGKRDQLSHKKIVASRNRRRWPPFTIR